MNAVSFKRLLLNLTRLRRGQLLRPLRHRLRDRRLWSLEHHCVAKGAALGVFFGILLPVAHVLFAIVSAIGLRANVVVAALATFISNPLTLPVIYYTAYRIGAVVTQQGAREEHVQALTSAEEAAGAALEVHEWFPLLLEWISSVGLPTAVGVVTLAFTAAITVYAFVFAIWGTWTRLRR
jgi:uncharacterized protein (DUF2062 family)